MKRRNIISSIFILTLLILLYSCNNRKEKDDGETIVVGNKSTTISSNISKLEEILNFNKIKPQRVKFEYTFYDNSGWLLSGPSDSYLEAVLYFDSTTFEKIRQNCKVNYDSTSDLRKENFNFEWLDSDVRDELMKSDTTYRGQADHLFGSGPHGNIWLLDKKLILTKPAN